MLGSSWLIGDSLDEEMAGLLFQPGMPLDKASLGIVEGMIEEDVLAIDKELCVSEVGESVCPGCAGL